MLAGLAERHTVLELGESSGLEMEVTSGRSGVRWGRGVGDGGEAARGEEQTRTAGS